jgi:multidrug efflux pump subunit AcrB
MTSLAFIIGTIPLAVAAGAGSAGRRILGTTVIGGMLTATLLAVFLIPAMFAVVEKLSARLSRGRGPQAAVAKVTGDGSAP